MKHFVELSSDCIVDCKFSSNRVPNSNEIEWSDKEKNLANGKYIVNGVKILTIERDSQGYATGKLTEAWLSRDDIVKLSDKIKEIEVSAVAHPDDDLPF